MSAPVLSAEAGLGQSVPVTAFQDNSNVVTIVGQKLKFSGAHALTEPDETRWHPGNSPHGISLVATCAKAQLFAFTERTLNPKIYVYSYPDLMPRYVLELPADATKPLEFTALAFQRNGEQLAALCGLPEPTLVVWSLKTQDVLATGPLLVPTEGVSFDPASGGAICTMASKRLLVWQLKLVYKTYLLDSTEVRATPRRAHQEGREGRTHEAATRATPTGIVLPLSVVYPCVHAVSQVALEEAEGASPSWTSHSWAPGSSLYVSTDAGVVSCIVGGTPTTVLRCSGPVHAILADATHLLVGASDGQLKWYGLPYEGEAVEELNEAGSALFSTALDAKITSLAGAPDYTKVLASTSAGETFLVRYTAEELPLRPANSASLMDVEKVSAFHTAGVVAAAPLPVLMSNGSVAGYDIVSCSLDGTLRCVDALTRMEVGRASSASAAPPTALATSPPSMLIALGTGDGVLRLYTRRFDAMPLLALGWRGKLSAGAVTALAFSPDGGHLAAACADGTLALFRLPRNSTEPVLLPSFTLPSSPTAMCWTAKGEVCVALSDRKLLLVTPASGAAGEVASLDACPSILIESVCHDLIEAPASITKGAAVTLLAACADRGVHTFEISRTAIGAAKKADPLDTLIKCDKAPNALGVSMDGQFLAVGASDGTLAVVPLPDLSEATTLPLHDSIAGGTTGVVLVPDVAPNAPAGSSLAYSVGADGTMVLTTIQPGGYGSPPPVVDPTPLPMGFVTIVDKDSNGVPVADGVPVVDVDAEGAEPPEAEVSVMEQARIAGNSGLAESAARDALQAKVDALRADLVALMAANDLLPDDDLEKLQPTDFIIDLEQQGKWRDEGTQKVDALKGVLAKENLQNELVSARMKTEFWESMAQPAVTLHAMVVPGIPANRQQGVKVNSYTVPKTLASKAETIGFVGQLRKVELKLDAWEAADAAAEASYRTSTSFESPATFAHDIAKVLSDTERIAAAQAAQEAKGDDKDKEKKKKEDEGEGDEGDDKKEAAEEVSKEDTNMLYATFESHTKWRKVSQMAMHGDVQLSLKEEFNTKLQAMLNAKRAELEKIKEKQVRIGEIEVELGKLGSASDGEPTLVMGMHIDEEPEKLLEVTDAEIEAPKYVSKEEKARLAKLEEERIARELASKGDNLGQRGLKVMMDGTLETRKEEDELFIELVKPDALLRQEAGEELLDDDKALVKDFLDKQKKFDAEREKRSKGLLTELAKLRVEIQDVCNSFNERAKFLKDTKMAYDGAIYESELLIIRLAQARLNKETFEKRSSELETELVTQKDSNKDSMSDLAIFTVELQAQQELVETLNADDKALEKGFKRDFADVPEFVEQLKKLFSRRNMIDVPKGTKAAAAAQKGGAAAAPAPKKQGTAPVMLGLAAGMGGGGGGDVDEGPALIAGGRDPFGSLDEPELEQDVEPLDAGVDMPEGLSFDVWDRLVEARNVKVAAEEALQAEQATLTSMVEYHQLLAVKDEKLRSRIEVLSSTLGERGEQELRGDWNLELPFKLKQGQVEVEEAAVVTDFGGALLIHRSEVADLNGSVRQLGKEKTVILKEIRDFRKGIVMLEWENHRADMEAEDLIERTKEFQLLRVTKDLQGKIRGGSEDNQQVEVAALEKKLEQLKAAHEDKVADLRRQVAKINAMIADRNNEMESLGGQIEQLEGSVLEREMIHEIQSQSNDGTGDGFKRFEEMHMKRKLQTLVGMQTQEIGLLRDELDRLRRRTFPTFTHIDNRASADRAAL